MIDFYEGSKLYNVYRNRSTGECVLVGHVNEIGGICDDCSHEISNASEDEWELLGNVAEVVNTLAKEAPL